MSVKKPTWVVPSPTSGKARPSEIPDNIANVFLGCFLTFGRTWNWKWEENYSRRPGKQLHGHRPGMRFPLRSWHYCLARVFVASWKQKTPWGWSITTENPKSRRTSASLKGTPRLPALQVKMQGNQSNLDYRWTKVYMFISMSRAGLKTFLYEEIRFLIYLKVIFIP